MAKIDDYRDKTDEKLVRLSLENQSDFFYIMKRYEDRLFKYVRRISNFGAEETEDVLQEVFIKVYRNLNSFDLVDSEVKFSSWIYRITHNQVISEFRKKKARPEYFSGETNDELLNNLVSDLDLVGDADSRYLKNNVNKILARLDQKYREALILKFLEEKDYKEISDILKKPMGTVATLINRAKSQFRKEAEKKNLEIIRNI